MRMETLNSPAGILLLNKPPNKTSFSMVALLRRILKVDKIGHAGTLDPIATGLLVMLIGKKYTTLSSLLLNHDKEYVACLKLGIETDSFDCAGVILSQNSRVPLLEEIESCLLQFQGKVMQIPPMFSAKKVKGKKLYESARKGIVVERTPCEVHLATELLEYTYPFLHLKINCSKGTYVRSIAHDLGKALGCGAHLAALQRTRSGPFSLANSIDGALLDSSESCRELLYNSLITHHYENCLCSN